MAVDSISSSKTTIDKILEQGKAKTEDRKVGDMGKDEFLNLLITQLRYQDPLNPTDDKAFIGQMAQFSALEQSQNLNNSMASIKGINFLGRTIKATIVDSTTKQNKDVEGVVSDVKMSKDGAVAIVNGTEVPIDKVTNITDSALGSGEQDVSRYTGYIGFKVKGTYTDADKNNLSVTGTVKQISKGALHEEAVVDGAKVNMINVDAPTRLTTAEAKQQYLESKKGQEITVTTADDTNKYAMKVTGILNNFTVGNDGKISVTLDDVRIPVKSVTSVMDARY